MTLIADVFPKLQTQKNIVRSMPKKLSFKGSFGKQHGKRAQTLLKFAWQHLLPYLLIAVKAIDLQKVSVSDMKNFKTVSYFTECLRELFSF